jgi:hypothetical protein
LPGNGTLYSVTVTDANGCSTVDQLILQTGCFPAGTACDDGDPGTFDDLEDGSCHCSGTPCPALAAGLTLVDVRCFGSGDGAAAAMPSGGTAPYAIRWSNGTTGSALSDLSSGDYGVTITDAHGCNVEESFIISEPELLTTLITGTNETFPGALDGAADLHVEGGTLPYAYQWSTGATTEDLNNLPGNGTLYSVTVTDANGCSTVDQLILQTGCLPAGTACDDGDPGTFDDMEDGSCHCAGTPCPALAAGLTLVDVRCFGSGDGAAAAMPSGGTAPYAIRWSNGTTGSALSDLTYGDYGVTITDAHGCNVEESFIISEPGLLTTLMTGTIETFPGALDGAADLHVEGGTLPYVYQWSTGATTEDLNNLPGNGTLYSVTVTDANGCSTVDQLILQTGCFPVGTACDDGDPGTFDDVEDGSCHCAGTSCDEMNIELDILEPTCSGASDGYAAVNPSGGKGPYEILWSTGSNDFFINNIDSGSYSVMVIDKEGCFKTVSFTIEDPALITLDMLATNESYEGSADGLVDLTVVGGTGPYEYNWSNGASTQDIDQLTGGGRTYSVTVTDAQGCTANASVEVHTGCRPEGSICDDGDPATYHDQEDGYCRCTGIACPKLELPINLTQVSCFGALDGAARLDTSALNLTSISWSSGEYSPIIEGLRAGTYQVTVVSDVGCYYLETFEIIEPPPLEVDLEGTDETGSTASDGRAWANIKGGTPPYRIEWSNGSIGPQIDNLEGNRFYIATVQDQAGCRTIDSIYIAEFVCASLYDKGVFEVKTVVSNDCKSNQEIIIQSKLLDTDLEYSLDGLVFQKSPGFAVFSDGKYQPVIKDLSNGCLLSLGELQLGQPAELAITTRQPTECNARDGALTNPDPEYEISLDGNGPWYHEQIDDLAPGNYLVFARMIGESCSFRVGTFVLGENTEHRNYLTISRSDAPCGENLGKMEIFPDNDTMAYSIDGGRQWYRGRQVFAVSPGEYRVYTGAKDCPFFFGSVMIAKNTTMNLGGLETGNPAHCDSRDGFIQVYSGENLSYSLNRGLSWRTDGLFEDLSIGKYQIWYRNNGETCLDSVEVQLTAPEENLEISVEARLDPSCYSGADGYIELRLNTDPSLYHFNWNHGAEGAMVGGLPSGAYEVTVSKETFCHNLILIELTDPPPLDIKFPPVDTVTYCHGQSILVSLPDSTLTYTWKSENQIIGTGNQLLISGPGHYSVSARDHDGCRTTRDFEIDYSDQLFQADFLLTSLALTGQPVHAVEVSWPVPDQVSWEVEGGSIVDTYLNQSVLVFDRPGDYRVIMKALKYGCMSVVEKSIQVVGDSTQFNLPMDIPGESIRLILFPNPNKGVFDLIVQLSEASALQIRIYNEDALLVYSRQFDVVNALLHHFDLSGSVAGIYTLLLQSKQGWKTVNFVIE